jgi:hypothetical protein
MTPRELYASIFPQALAAYAASTVDLTSAKQMAHFLSKSVVDECVRLGVLEIEVEVQQQDSLERRAKFGVGTPGVPEFAASAPAGAGAAPIAPVGAPGAPVRHYNHIPSEAGRAGAAAVAPTSDQAGVMNVVTQAPTPEQGPSAFGTGGVIAPVVQKPSGREVVVAPQNQPMIPHVGGNGTTFVPEKIAR